MPARDPLTPDPKLYGVPFETDVFNGMPYRRLGTSGLRASNIGLGTWKFGFPETGDSSRVGAKEAMAIFDKAVEEGVTFWDTANRYNNASGNSERLIGQWFRSNPDQRRNVLVATKVYGGMDGVSPNHSRLSRHNILDAVDACLQRLQLEYVDLLYFHRFDGTTPLDESLAAVDDLIRRDKVRYFAGSNFTADQVKLCAAVEKDIGPRVRLLAVQNQFDLLNRESPEYKGTLEYCAEAGVSYVAWSPLARGLLTDRYLDPKKAGKGDRLVDEGNLDKLTTPAVLAKLNALAKLAREADLSLAQLALAYMLTLPGMGPAIPSSSSVQQVSDNAKAGKVELNRGLCGKIENALSAKD